MCIIVICETEKPELKFLKRCERENPHGGGISWRTQDGQVKWAKGLTAEEVFKLSQKVKLPFVIHFRITSSGSNTSEFNHPFPIGGGLGLSGSSDKGVLFHNGTWKEWSALLYRTFPKPLPNGDWNDSRTMAYITQEWGTNWLRLPASYNRICVFTPKKILLFGSWVTEGAFRLSHTMNYRNYDGPITDLPYQGQRPMGNHQGWVNRGFAPRQLPIPVTGGGCDPDPDELAEAIRIEAEMSEEEMEAKIIAENEAATWVAAHCTVEEDV